MKKPVKKRRGYDQGGSVQLPPAWWRPEESGKPAQGPFGPMLGGTGPVNLRQQTWEQNLKDTEAASQGKARGGKVRKVIPAKKARR